MLPSERQRLLGYAETLLGGAQLAQKLGVSQPLLERYKAGEEPLPDPIFLRLVDVLFEHWRAAEAPPSSRHKPS